MENWISWQVNTTLMDTEMEMHWRFNSIVHNWNWSGSIYVSDEYNHCIQKISKIKWTPSVHHRFPSTFRSRVRHCGEMIASFTRFQETSSSIYSLYCNGVTLMLSVSLSIR